MDTLGRTAGQLDEAAAELTRAARTTSVTGSTDPGLGAAGPGRLGDLTRDLRDQWIVATAARSEEATAAATRLAETADRLRAAAGRYQDTDHAARQRQPGEA